MDYKKEYEILKDQLETERLEKSRQADREYREREEERKRRKQAYLDELCQADNWDEAFHKGIMRLEGEAATDTEDDDFFTHQLEEHQFAKKCFDEEMAAIRERIVVIRGEAELRVARLEQIARNRAARRVDKQFKRKTAIGDNLRDDNLSALVEW